ncbi:phosphonopyruvate decarboxylase [Spirochaetia bacterium]|nr:phosphonopyruvate decarboxylase [Spirochaetia bacterium]
MIKVDFFYRQLINHGTEFFSGVPDSLLKSFCAWLTCHAGKNKHIIAVNEGAAVGLASGYHLATGKIPLVYMQNSGIGNAVNPLLSLADGDVYRIPLLLLIGWRGEAGTRDEPQHIKQGKVTLDLFDAMKIPFCVLSDKEDEAAVQLDEAYRRIQKDQSPFALIVRKDTFAPYVPDAVPAPEAEMSRESAIEEIILSSAPEELFISTTGMASRELYELREKHGQGHEKDFLTVGSMGHASSVALGLALQKPELPVTCLDGDGAALMHLGSLAAIGAERPANLRHIVLNNGAHDSVGGQPTIAREIDLGGIARAAGYTEAVTVRTMEELKNILKEKKLPRPSFIEIMVRKGNRKDLGRPLSSPPENKESFMRFIAGEKT